MTCTNRDLCRWAITPVISKERIDKDCTVVWRRIDGMWE